MSTSGQTAENLRVAGKKINCMDEGFTPGLMVGPMMGSTLKTKNKASVSTYGQTARDTRANG